MKPDQNEAKKRLCVSFSLGPMWGDLLHLCCLMICLRVFIEFLTRWGFVDSIEGKVTLDEASPIWLSVKMRDMVWKKKLFFASPHVGWQFVWVTSFSLLTLSFPSLSLSKLCGLLFQCFEKLSLARVGWKLSEGGGGGEEEHWAEEASEGLPLYLPAQTSIMSDSPSLFLSFPLSFSYVVRLLIGTNSYILNNENNSVLCDRQLWNTVSLMLVQILWGIFRQKN